MVNTVNKGASAEREAIAALQAEGYAVHRCVRTPVRTRGRWVMVANDVFGCIDLIAKKEGQGRTRWIQITAGRDIGRKIQDLAAIPWDNAHDSVEIWRWIGGGGKRLDGRTGLPRETQYFQVYRRELGFEPQPTDRVRRLARPAAGGRAAVAAASDTIGETRNEGHQYHGSYGGPD